ncbi:MAG: PAS domain S-box protein [Proteobacteria bacterium]|jgi:PAS domain S-box-containing protein|nr:HAMP domain-containing protein [Desulfocapsa sp.]MBU3944454.1 PAS domain S-box protein [Pseudomonadota bacterium]MCG2744546.1 ATP-binding protein [Desulfobacteraceae bacterium]MBU4044522.1 PAS domain S-box protein [Pseudomonadota bacterium]MBU4107640.1 PAS domain S-box protein [Pseudomonadota bacterium]
MMKLKHKILLQFVFLIALVSSAIIFTTAKLSEEGKKDVSDGVSSKLIELQKVSTAGLKTAKQIADKGVIDASGLVAIDQVTSITLTNQQEFYNTVGQEIDHAGDNISKTLEQQDLAIEESLDQLLAEATASVNRIMQLDRDSFSVISNAALGNVSYLQSAGIEGLNRFKADQKKFGSLLIGLSDENNFAIDQLLVDILTKGEQEGTGLFLLSDDYISQFDRLKSIITERQNTFIQEVFRTVDQQKRILAEEMRLAANNVKWAISSEQKNSRKIQAQEIENVIENLIAAQTKIQTRIDTSAKAVQSTIDDLKINLPIQLQQKGEKTNRVINEQINETRKDTAATQALVSKRIEENTQKALGVFQSAIDESQFVIEESLQSSQHKTAKLSFLIAVGCVVLGVILSFIMIKSLTRPISLVLSFADKLSNGNLSERLPEGPDEMGEMSKALNRMADELVKLQEATINSFNQTLDQVIDCVFMFDPDSLHFIYANQGALDHLGYDREELYDMTPLDIKPEITEESFRQKISVLKNNQKESISFITIHRNKAGNDIPVEILLKYAVPPGNDPRFVSIVRDISERIRERDEKEQIQEELLQIHKLESVGQLAAGLAHEINTPTQFIGTNIEFLSDAFTDTAQFVVGLQTASLDWPEETRKQMTAALEELDWEYLNTEIPAALEQSRDGIDRVSSLLAAMKRFSHPGSTEMSNADLHGIIDTALTVSRNEWKYVAEVITEYGADVPQIPLLVDQMSQVILNMVVNASQSIQEKREKSGNQEMGQITISTRLVDKEVELIFQDNGLGIPAAVINKVFDPFFTTKGVGKGTGQGLAICHDVITKKHHGTLKVSSEQGIGATFTIRLPREKNGGHVSCETEQN